MNKAYNKITWQNKPSTATPLNQTNLNEMSNALDTIDDRVIALDSGKVSSVTVTNTLQTGDTIATITVDGTATNIKSAQVVVDDTPSATSTNPLQNKAIYEMLNNLLPEETVQGNPIAISDASGLNAKACSVDLLPIQDLHGQSAPYVGGAGKNKCPVLAPQTSADIVVTNGSDGSVIFNGTANTTTDFFINLPALAQGNYVVSANNTVTISNTNTYIECLDSNNTRLGVVAFNNTTNAYFTISNSVPAKIKIRIAGGIQVTNFTLKIQLESGSTATDYAPYENICPISGRTEVSVKRTGINQWDEEWEQGAYNLSGEKVVWSGAIRSKNNISVFPNSQYYIKFSGTTIFYICWYNGNSFIERVPVRPSGVVTPPTNATKMTICTHNDYGTTYNNNISINYPSTDTDYHAYQGETYTETLGQTVYGGKVDFVSGKLTITRKYVKVKLSNADSTTQGTACDRYNFSNVFTSNEVLNSGNGNNNNSISSHIAEYKYNTQDNVHFYFSASGIVLFVPIGTPTTTEIEFCGTLTTPTEITLTAEQISLLKGNNVVSTDGDNIKLVYSADIKAWVENQLQS